MELNISLDSLNKVYYAGDYIQGSVLVINKSKTSLKFDLAIKVIGYYSFHNTKLNPPKQKAVFFYNKVNTTLKDGYIAIGSNSPFRFKFPLTSEHCQQNYSNLYESYRGASVSLHYEIFVEALTGGKQFSSKHQRILVMVPGQGINPQFGRKRVNYQFTLDPTKVENIKVEKNMIPQFLIEGYLENINCCLDKPFNGFCNIKSCSTQIKSIELQFLRNEKILHPEFEGVSEVSEIQNLQIGDGDVIRDLDIPVCMTFPRSFCCANLETKDAVISFEMNLIIVLVNGVVIMENYPVNLWRGG